MYSDIILACEAFFSEEQQDARRIFHGRGHMYDGLEHINLDWYNPVVLLTTYEESAGLVQLAQTIKAADKHDQIKSIVHQHRTSRGAPSECLLGDEISQCTVTENGLKFEVQPGVRQNAGLFLDMRPLRGWLMENSGGRNVLNLFSYTCALSVAALAGGARQVVNNDMSKPSINWGLRNHQLNGQDPRAVRSVTAGS